MLTDTQIRLHVRFNGRSEELTPPQLGLQPGMTDAELRTALARRYDCAMADLEKYVIVREQQAIIVRPVAIYG